MDLNKENMKKMRELIVFTIILLIALWNYKLLFEWIGFAFGIVTPPSSQTRVPPHAGGVALEKKNDPCRPKTQGSLKCDT